MSNYTVLTVFENTDTLNEPVISLPMTGRMSFRQIGIIIGIAVMLPMMIYSAGSQYILDILPDPVFLLVAVNGQIKITWDILLALTPIPLGLALGIPRPKLVPMDQLIILLGRFAIHHTSVKSATQDKKTGQNHKQKTVAKSAYAGFAKKEYITPTKFHTRNIYSVAVTELGAPKNVTITVYDTNGNLMRHKLARAYIDDQLLCSITTDADGIIGMTFVPKREGQHLLRVVIDEIKEPVLDAILNVKRH